MDDIAPWWTRAWSDEPADASGDDALPRYSSRSTVALPAVGWSMPALVRELAGRGYPASLPAAAFGSDGHGRERRVIAPLGRLALACSAVGLESPRLVLLGEGLEETQLDESGARV